MVVQLLDKEISDNLIGGLVNKIMVYLKSVENGEE
jgi:hypothetical protein